MQQPSIAERENSQPELEPTGLGKWFTLRNLWLWVVPWGLFMRLCLAIIHPNDFWWHVRTGQLILEKRVIPTIDLFTYTRPGALWINQAWLMQTLFALLMQWGGVPLVIFFHALTITTGYILILRACAPKYGVRTSVWATLIGVGIGIQSWAVRPQSFSFLAFGILIALIEAHRHGNQPNQPVNHRRALWWAIPLFAIWVNAHGVFVFGLAALGLYVVGTLLDALWAREWHSRRAELTELCIQGLLSLAALSLNPQGPIEIANYVLGFFQSKATIQYNVEFAPLMIRAADGMIFAFALLLLIVARLNSSTRLTTAQTLTLLAFIAMTLFSRRSAAWFGMVQIPILASLLRGWWHQPFPFTIGKPLITATLFGFFFLMTLFVLPWWRPQIPGLIQKYPLLAPTTPVEATQFLCDFFPPGTRGYQSIAYASYMEEACPDLPTFVDTRFELFPTELWQEYNDMQQGRYNWPTIADHYGMDYIFVDEKDQPNLIKAVRAHEEWQEIHHAGQAHIFSRNSKQDSPKQD